jgi:hypothetical protein
MHAGNDEASMARTTKRPSLLLMLLGVGLVAWGAQFFALMAAGQWTRAPIEYSVRLYGGSRGVAYRVHYSFDVPGGGAYKGSATTGASRPPAGLLRVRYLESWPAVNHPGTNGLLTFYSLVFLIPGAILMAVQLRTRARRPAP